MAMINQISAKLERAASLLALMVIALFVTLKVQAVLPGPTSVAFDKGALFTVDGYTNSVPLSGFPVLVRIAANSPSGFFYTDLHSPANGADIAFVDMEGNGLPFEIDTWDPLDTSLIWVKLSTMTNRTQFVMCWGSATSGKTVCNESPFADYVGVWHMSAASGSVADSSGNGLTAMPAGTDAATVSVAGSGCVGNGRQCVDKTYLSIANADVLDVGSSFAVSGWFDMSSNQPSGDVRFFSRKVRNQTTSDGWEVIRKSSNIAARGKTGDNIATYAATFAEAEWKHLFVVYNGDTATIYENGVAKKESGKADAAPEDNDNSFSIGSYSGGGSSYFVGNVDECRLLGAVPSASADWAKAEYDSIFKDDFLSPGTAEPYEATDDPVAGILISPIGYTNAMVVVSISDFGTGALSADVVVKLSATSDLASPLWTESYSATTTGARSFDVSGLLTNTTYFVGVALENNKGVAAEFGPLSFTTHVPSEPSAAASVSGRTAYSLSASVDISSIGDGSLSASVLLEASIDGFDSIASSCEVEVLSGGNIQLEVGGLSAFTTYGLRVRILNEWGLSSVVDLGHSTTLPASGLAELYVDSLGSGSGSSPDSALPTIREALDMADAGYTIWVRGGEGRVYAITNDACSLTIPSELKDLSIRGWDGTPLIAIADDYSWYAGGRPVISDEAAHVTLAGLRFEWTKNSLGQYITGQGTVGTNCYLVQAMAPFLTLSNCEFALSGDLPDGSYGKSGMGRNLFMCGTFDATNLLVEGCTFLDCRADSRNKDFTLFVVRDNARFVDNVFSNVMTVFTGVQLEGDRCTGPCSFVSNVVYRAGGDGHRGVFSAGYGGPKDRVTVTYNRFVNDDGAPYGSIFKKNREGFSNGPVFHHNTVVGFREFIFAENLGYGGVLLAAQIFDNIFVLDPGATNIVENSPCQIQGYLQPNSWSPTMFKSGSFYRKNALLTGTFNGGTAAALQLEDWTYDITARLSIEDTIVLSDDTHVPAGTEIRSFMWPFANTNDIFSVDFYRPKAVRKQGFVDFDRIGWTGENDEYPRFIGALEPLPQGSFTIYLR